MDVGSFVRAYVSVGDVAMRDLGSDDAGRIQAGLLGCLAHVRTDDDAVGLLRSFGVGDSAAQPGVDRAAAWGLLHGMTGHLEEVGARENWLSAWVGLDIGVVDAAVQFTYEVARQACLLSCSPQWSAWYRGMTSVPRVEVALAVVADETKSGYYEPIVRRGRKRHFVCRLIDVREATHDPAAWPDVVTAHIVQALSDLRITLKGPVTTPEWPSSGGRGSD